jgi:hypothetical protein
MKNENECFDLEKREGCECPKCQSPTEVKAVAIERMERTEQDLGKEARGVWKVVTIRLEDIEGPHRK